MQVSSVEQRHGSMAIYAVLHRYSNDMRKGCGGEQKQPVNCICTILFEIAANRCDELEDTEGATRRAVAVAGPLVTCYNKDGK